MRHAGRSYLETTVPLRYILPSGDTIKKMVPTLSFHAKFAIASTASCFSRLEKEKLYLARRQEFVGSNREAPGPASGGQRQWGNQRDYGGHTGFGHQLCVPSAIALLPSIPSRLVPNLVKSTPIFPKRTLLCSPSTDQPPTFSRSPHHI